MNSHILHGLDADLIMLGLATHEQHFYILREEVIAASKQVARCILCGSEGHLYCCCADVTRRASECQGKAPPPRGALGRESKYMKQRLQILHLPVLREYLQGEFQNLERVIRFPYDFENIIDDIVFFCFLVGNDFLPHLPCLEIREGGLNLLFNLYKSLLPTMDGYLTSEGGIVNLRRAHLIFNELAKIEGEILRRRRYGCGGRVMDRAVQLDNEYRKRSRNISVQGLIKAPDLKKMATKNKEEINLDQDEDDFDKAAGFDEDKKKEMDDLLSAVNDSLFAKEEKEKKKVEAKETAEFDHLTEEEKLSSEKKWVCIVVLMNRLNLEVAKKFYDMNKNDDVVDTVRMGEEGWQSRYYQEKFGKTHKLTSQFYEDIAQKYVEGLQWVMQYYYRGVPSWEWFYPYHYAPCAFTLARFNYKNAVFKIGKAFRPLDQLMANQPPGCAYLLPKPMQELMTSPNSPIKDFYPKRVGVSERSDVQIDYDTNGKPFRWLWTALISFIDQDRLTAAVDSVMSQLTPEDIYRNRVGVELLCVGTDWWSYE